MSTTQQQQLHGSPSASSSIQIPSQNGMRTVTITDMSQSVGGTLYGTTPGGTRIKYDRSMLLRLSSSPVSRTPPKGLPVIPGVTKASCNDSKPQVPAQASVDETDGEDDGTTGGSTRLAAQQHQHQPQPQQSKHDDDDEHMFDME